jgi:hypothetical protein
MHNMLPFARKTGAAPVAATVAFTNNEVCKSTNSGSMNLHAGGARLEVHAATVCGPAWRECSTDTAVRYSLYCAGR